MEFDLKIVVLCIYVFGCIFNIYQLVNILLTTSFKENISLSSRTSFSFFSLSVFEISMKDHLFMLSGS